MRNFLGIFPRKLTSQELEIKLFFWLSLSMMVLLCYHIFNGAVLKQQVAVNQAQTLSAQIRGTFIEADLQAFERDPFCGWQLDSIHVNATTTGVKELENVGKMSSKYFDDNGLSVRNEVSGRTLFICVKRVSSSGQIVFVLFVYAILFYIFYSKFLTTTNTLKDEIPTA